MDAATVECLQCGALNGAEFGRCIRCNASLADAAPADGIRRRVAARRGRGVAVGGSEALLGRWPAETLPVAKALLAVNMAVFALQLMADWRASPSLSTLLGGGALMEALRAGAMITDFEFIAHEPWRLLSACFVHFGVIHIGMNMLALLSFARMLEPAIGSVRLLVIYVVTGIVGFACSLAWYGWMGEPVPTAGASGAICGLMGAILGFLLRRRDERWKRWLGQTVGFTLLFGLMPGLHINNSAHLGGIVSGLALGMLVSPGAPQPSRVWQRALAAVCALAVVASLVLVHLSA